jgi:multiple sugar transport system substrate-binding protein
MTVDNAVKNDQETGGTRRRWPLVVVAVVMIFSLAAMMAIGSILVNVEWPTNLGTWIKAVLGGLLVAVSTLWMTYALEAAKAIFKDKGGATRDNEEKYALLERISNIRWPRIVWTVGVATVVIITATALLPRIQLPSGSPPELGQIRVMSAIDESPRDPRFMLIQQWNTAHPDNKVDIIPVPGETDAQHASMVRDAKEDHDADVYVLDVVWMPEFVKNGYIRPIDETTLDSYVGDDFLPNVLELCRGRVDGDRRLWALPLNSDAGLQYYRSDLGVAAAKTWDDYFGASAKATLADVRNRPGVRETAPNLESANAAQLAREEILTVTALEAMWAAGGEVVNRSGEVSLNEDKSEVVFDSSALVALRDLAAAADDPGIVLPGAEEMDESAATRAFSDGQTLFMRNWPVAYDNLTEGDERAASFEVSALPHDSALGGQNLAISTTTGKPRVAQELIEFLTSPSSQLTLFEIGGFAPTRPSAYINSRRPYAQDLRTAVERARVRPNLVHYTEFSIEFRNCVARAINNGGKLEPDCPRKLAEIVNR